MTPNLQSDETAAEESGLICSAQAGDQDAFAALIDRHISHVRTFLALKAPVSHLVDELAHDTFVFACRHLGEFAPGTSLRAWLRAIAWNLLHAEVQRFAREQRNLDRLATWQAEASLSEVGHTEPPVEAEHLQHCLEELPEPLRELIVLKYRDESSTDEIAARLKRSVVWVRVSLFRVRAQLRECIEAKLSASKPC